MGMLMARRTVAPNFFRMRASNEHQLVVGLVMACSKVRSITHLRFRLRKATIMFQLMDPSQTASQDSLLSLRIQTISRTCCRIGNLTPQKKASYGERQIILSASEATARCQRRTHHLVTCLRRTWDWLLLSVARRLLTAIRLGLVSVTRPRLSR